MGVVKPIEHRKEDVSRIQKSLPCNNILRPSAFSPVGLISSFNTAFLAEVMYEVSSGVGMCGKMVNTTAISRKAIDTRHRIAKSALLKLTLMDLCDV